MTASARIYTVTGKTRAPKADGRFEAPEILVPVLSRTIWFRRELRVHPESEIFSVREFPLPRTE